MRAFVIAALAFALSGCVSIVEVQSDGGKPEIHFGLGSAKIGRGDAKAFAVKEKTFGSSIVDCGAGFTAFLGYSKVSCIVIDPKTCTAAIIYDNPNTNTDLVGKIADVTRVQCYPKGDEK